MNIRRRIKRDTEREKILDLTPYIEKAKKENPDLKSLKLYQKAREILIKETGKDLK